MGRYSGSPLPLGVTEQGEYVNFSISVSGVKCCKLLLYRKGAEQVESSWKMLCNDVADGICYIALPRRIVKGREYLYEMDGKFVIDPYAKELCTCTSGMTRSKVLLDSYDWEGDRPLQIPQSDVIAYSLHVRGFTKNKSSKVRGKGTFKGIVEKIPYLLELGVNQIQCMPIYAFNVAENYTNYWGYGEGFYFAPQPKYAIMKSAAREWKDTIKACHRAGIEVVLNLPFSESFTPQMIVDCLRHYVLEYHIDGFLLDPMRVSIEGAKADPILMHCKIWEQKQDYCMDVRRFLRGDNYTIEGMMFWQKANTAQIGSCNYVASHNGFTLADAFSYNEKHNEDNGENNQDGPDYNCSYNCGKEGITRKKSVLELRRQMMKNAFFILLTAQGVPCILAGDEFANSQAGNNNVYCQDNETAWLDWRQCSKETWLVSYVKRLIAIRKKCPILHSAAPLLGRDYVGCGVPDVSFHSELAWQIPSGMSCKSMGIYYHDDKQEISECFVAYNADEEARIIALPALSRGRKWHLVISTQDQDGEIGEWPLENQRSITLAAREMALYIGK